MNTTKRSPSKKAIWATLLVALIAVAVFVALRLNESRTEAMLLDVDDGIALGYKASNAVAAYHAANGRYPASLDDTPVKIAQTAGSEIAVDPQTGEVTVTLKSKKFDALDGKKMHFKALVISGHVISVQCRADDEAFRQLVGERCS